MTLIWAEEFDGTGTPTNWHPQNYRHTGSDMYFADNGFCQSQDSNGVYNLSAFPANTPDGHTSWVPGGDSMGFMSPQIDTWDKLAVPVNSRVEASIKAPNTKGILPAFWLLGHAAGPNQGWPACGEIDIVEFPSHIGSHAVSQNLHGPTTGNQWADKSFNAAQPEMDDYTTEFHEYAVEWRPTDITWLIDGVQTAKVTQSQYMAAGGDWTPFNGSNPFYVLLSIYVGGSWTGEPDATSKFPVTMGVDWVRCSTL